MTIRELERQTGLPRTTIRFYEQGGPDRSGAPGEQLS